MEFFNSAIEVLHFEQETGIGQIGGQLRVCRDIISDSITSLCSG